MDKTFSIFQILAIFVSIGFAFCACILLHILKKYKSAIILLLFSAFLIRLLIIFFDPYLNWWDERFHAVVAKNMLKDPFVPVFYPEEDLPHTNSWVGCHVWLHKPPLFLWQSALSMKILGINVFGFRLPGAILSFLTLLLLYDMARRWLNKYIAFYAVLLLSFSSFALDLVSGYHTSEQNDISFIFYVTLSIWSLARYLENNKLKWIIIIGVGAGAAVLTKWLMGLVVFVIWGIIIILFKDFREQYQSYVHITISFMIALFIFLPWNIYAYINFREVYLLELHEKARHFTQTVEGHAGDFLWHWRNFQVIYAKGVNWLIFPALYLLWKYLRQIKIKVLFITFFLVVLLFYSFAKTKMAAFTLITQSVVFLALGTLTYKLLLFLKPRYRHWRVYGQFSAIVILFLLILWMLDVDSIRKKHTCWDNDYCYWRTRWIHSVNIFKQLKQDKNIPIGSVFLNLRPDDHAMLMFFTDFVGYNGLPDSVWMSQLQKSKRTLFLFTKDDIGDFLNRYPWVTPIDYNYWNENFSH